MSSFLEAKRRACLEAPPHPPADWMRRAGGDVMAAMIDDFVRLGEGGIGQTATRAAMENLLRQPPPETGTQLSALLDEFRGKILPNAYRPNHPRFLAFIPSAPTFASVLGDCLAGGANLFAGVWKEAAGPAQIEINVLDWFKEWLGLPPEAAGILTGGGSEANLTALVVARDPWPRADWQRHVLYVPEHRHWSIDRAAKIIGLAPAQVRSLPCDADFRLDVAALRVAVAADEQAGWLPWLVAASAGATNTGSVDPLGELAEFCRQRNLWLHVDAAYGWPIVLTAQGRALLCGIEQADSITLDPHKWFAQGYEAGCLLVRCGQLLHDAFAMLPDYMQDVAPRPDEINFCDHGIALTRRFRALKIWFSVKLLGVAWFRRLIEHNCALADYAQALLEQTGRFEITCRRSLSIVCFRYLPRRDLPLDPLQRRIADELARGGEAFLSTTQLGGRTTLRLCFVNWRTTAEDVERVVALLERIGAAAE